MTRAIVVRSRRLRRAKAHQSAPWIKKGILCTVRIPYRKGGSLNADPFWLTLSKPRSPRLYNPNSYCETVAHPATSRTPQRTNGTIEFAKPKDKAKYKNVTAAPDLSGEFEAVEPLLA